MNLIRSFHRNKSIPCMITGPGLPTFATNGRLRMDMNSAQGGLVFILPRLLWERTDQRIWLHAEPPGCRTLLHPTKSQKVDVLLLQSNVLLTTIKIQTILSQQPWKSNDGDDIDTSDDSGYPQLTDSLKFELKPQEPCAIGDSHPSPGISETSLLPFPSHTLTSGVRKLLFLSPGLETLAPLTKLSSLLYSIIIIEEPFETLLRLILQTKKKITALSDP